MEHKQEFSHPGDADWRASDSMASSSKRKVVAAAGGIGVDDVVWAKIKGYRAWPARVSSLLSGGTRATVVFFGTRDTATLGVADLTVWDTESGARLAKKPKTKDFAQAVAEAEDASGFTLRQSSQQKQQRMNVASPPADTVASPAEGAGGDDQNEELVCQVCGTSNDEANILLCDGCPHGYHLSCLTPALSSIPAGDWHCPTCTANSEVNVEDTHASDGLSAYEQQRLDNIARNEAMLRQLNIQPLETMPPRKPRARAVRGLKASRRSTEPEVRRERSLRIAGKTPDGAELPPTFREPTFAEMRFAGDSHHRDRIEGELKLADALREEGKGMKRKPKCGEVEDEETDETIAQRKADSAAKFGSIVGGLAVPDKRLHSPAYDEGATLRMLAGLQVRESDVAKVVPERIFSMDFHPSRSKLLLAVGDKWGSIGFFDPDAEEEDAVTLFSVHTRPIPCLHFDAHDSAKLYSSSYDNTLRCLDIAAMEFTEIFAGDADYHLAYSAYSKDHKTAYLAFNTGELGLVDLRAGKEMKQIVELHERKISHVDVHPTRDWSIVTASNDCTVKLWDARKLGRPSDALASFSHGRAATSAIFSPVDGNRLLTTSYDDLVRVIELPTGGAGKISVDDGFVTKLRHDNQTGRWLTNFRATWDPKSDNTYAS